MVSMTAPDSSRRAATVAALALVGAPGCGDEPSRDSTGAGDMYCPATSHVGPGDSACDSGRGGPMREIPLAGGGTMCIDKTEVTVGQYQAFVASGEDPVLAPSDPAAERCAEETNREASCYSTPCDGAACDLPQPCVSQCDAKLFCEWAGKQLCGPTGDEPLGIDRADILDPTKNQWRNACSPDGMGWPYGEPYDSQACNTSDRQPQACSGPTTVASFVGCQAPAGPYDQVFDLSGNLFEWVDASQEAAGGWPDRRCIIMGGSYGHYWGDAGCGEYSTLDWPCDARNPGFGFRCCSR